ncbi:hypothetical protein PZE06_14275 [Robertmurraya sp. DFI.2.37]|uniref:hypothetical protein n=1 Tax=Robertmurraya sp. DFI.2.37 TaxID=3031819 RepID=UPI0012476F34|nr:hypothetical protein [Robertmurraya sp. DFI.2.37]MDF1509334.1 hypothetical protein [Robertmurraya sp. DFI.2.37]
MKKKLLLTAISATLSMGILGACGVNNNRMNDDDGVNYSPVRYDRQDDTGVFDGNRRNNGVEPVRFRSNDNNRGIFNDVNNRTNNGVFDTNHNLNTDLIDNNRGANGIDPGTNGRRNVNAPTGTMRGGSR